MGLFGLFYTMFVGGTKCALGVKTNAENEKKRKEAISKGTETYVDNKGCLRLVSNNKKVMKTYVYNKFSGGEYKDYVLKYVDSNIIVRNYSREKRRFSEEKKYAIAKEFGKTVYRLGDDRDSYIKTNLPGYRYKDLNTGDIYVIRQLNGVLFYMDINTGLFIRETDGEIEKRNDERAYHHDKKEYEMLRQKMNKSQQEYFDKNGKINSQSTKCICGGRDWYED